MEYLLYFEAFILVAQVIKNKLYKSSVAILYLFVFNTFVSPVVYYDLLNGKSYITFSDSDFNKYISIGCIYLVFIICINSIMRNHKMCRIFSPWGNIRIANSKIVIKWMGIGILVACFGYVLVFRDRYPLLQQLFHHNMMALLDRPDVSGNIPFYFTMSTIICSFFPMFYFFYKERRNKEKDLLYTAAWYGIIVFIMLVGGNKGIIVYFAFFIWIYIWRMRIDWRIVSAGVLLLYIYEVTIYGSVKIFDGQLLEGLVSPLRRFFVTQGAMFINRIPLIESGIDLSDQYISAYVYTRVYGGAGGSAPTYFIGDLMIRYGYVIGMIIGMMVTFIIFLISKSLDSNKEMSLYKYWAQFYMIYLIGNASISSSFLIRAAIVIILVNLLSVSDRSDETFRLEEFSNVISN